MIFEILSTILSGAIFFIGICAFCLTLWLAMEVHKDTRSPKKMFLVLLTGILITMFIFWIGGYIGMFGYGAIGMS